jgi:hypothetical protein
LAAAFFVRFTAAFFAGFACERAAALKALLGIASRASEVVSCPAPSRCARAMIPECGAVQYYAACAIKSLSQISLLYSDALR